jgi:hypothetical protein
MSKYLTIYEEAVSHMTLQLLLSEFPYMGGKFSFLYISAMSAYTVRNISSPCLKFSRLVSLSSPSPSIWDLAREESAMNLEWLSSSISMTGE